MLDPGESPVAKLPEWLLPGWSMEVRERSSGLKDKYYIDPMYGYKFRSKKEVFRYLGYGWDIDAWTKPRITSSGYPGGDADGSMNEPSVGSLVLVAQDIVDVGKSTEWLPSNWKLELRQRKGILFRVDKYYIDPTNKYKFRSKREVLRHLGLVIGNNTSAPIDQDISAKVEKSPTWLPSDWRAETKERKNGSKAKKYVNPVSGRKLYSKSEVPHYLESGEFRKPIKKRGGKKKSGVKNAESVCEEISLYTEGRTQKLGCSSTSRCQFTGQSLNTSETGNDEFKCKTALAATPSSFGHSECMQNNMVCVDNGYSIRKHRKRKSEPEPYKPRVCKNLSLPPRTSRRVAGLPPESAHETTKDNHTPAVVVVVEKETGEVEHYFGTEGPPNKVSKASEVETLEVEHCNAIEDISNKLRTVKVETAEVEHSLVIKDQPKTFKKAGVESVEVEHCISTEDGRKKVGKGVLETGEDEHSLFVKDLPIKVGKTSKETGMEIEEVKKRIGIRYQSNRTGNAEVKTGKDEHLLVMKDQSNNVGKAFEAKLETREVEHFIGVGDQSNKHGKGKLDIGEVKPSIGKASEDLGGGPEEHIMKKLASKVPGAKVFFSFGGVPLFDPCIEFAFNTLTGSIPVEDNLHQCRSSAPKPSTSGFGLPDVNSKRLL